jgi:hypothetical protein
MRGGYTEMTCPVVVVPGNADSDTVRAPARVVATVPPGPHRRAGAAFRSPAHSGIGNDRPVNAIKTWRLGNSKTQGRNLVRWTVGGCASVAGRRGGDRIAAQYFHQGVVVPSGFVVIRYSAISM